MALPPHDLRPPTINVATLVVHRTGDLAIPVEHGRYLAEHIPGARLVELPGFDHLPWFGDADAYLDFANRKDRQRGCVFDYNNVTVAVYTRGEIIERGKFGVRTVRFTSSHSSGITAQIERLGHVPLPPYIERADESADRERYQTVFARNPGAIAAPTAGLHFSEEILKRIRARGAEICELTLNVGLGTFQPVHGETLEEHVMHSESYQIPRETVERINAASAAGRAIFAIGTTVVRALEDSALRTADAGSSNVVTAGKAEAKLFITPGFRFRAVSGLLTNFHLPRSTLLALVCAFAGRENVLAAYRHAVEAGYRFYSYGDCMLIR